MSFLYLASPYTSPQSHIMEERFNQVASLTAQYLRKGIAVYSPIVHCHELAKKYHLPKDSDFWLSYNYAMLECASKILIYQLPGWITSKGVQAEIDFATANRIPLSLIPYTPKD